MQATQVYRIDFSQMENDEKYAVSKKLLGTFIDKDGRTANGNASNFISKLEPTNHYLCWDGLVYPQFKIEIIEIG